MGDGTGQHVRHTRLGEKDVLNAAALLKQVGKRRTHNSLVRVVARHRRYPRIAVLDTGDDRRQDVGQLRTDRKDALGINLRRGDLQ
jgi:hypothetical protein